MKKSPIIILHGWGLSGGKFDALRSVLTALGYTVYNPDLPGFGKAATPTSAYQLSDYSDFLHEFIVKNAIDNPILIGHSFGGRVALKYLYSKPLGAKAVIFTGTPGYTPVPRKRLVFFIFIAKIGKFFFSIWPISLLQEKIRSWYYYIVGARDYYRANIIMREIFKHIVQEDLSLPIASVRIPTALIWGKLDQITPVWIAEKMQSVIQNSTLSVLEDADHGVSYKKPELFAKSVDAFIKTI